MAMMNVLMMMAAESKNVEEEEVKNGENEK
jgi:hypothetical protein